MKTLLAILVCLASASVATRAQNVSGTQSTTAPQLPAPTAYHVVERGGNYNVWQRETYEAGPNGQVFTHVHKVRELGSGMNYQNADGQWAASQEQIQAYANGAIAQNGQYQVIFADNLNSTGAIDQQTPDGKRLRSNILGLAYYDDSTGQSVMIAQIQDAQGELISANQVLYPNAFTGVKADVRYTYKKGSFEQDVILREQPPTPESLGLNSATTEIEVMTEFIDPPPETIVEHSSPNGGGIDQDVSWGTMRLGHGKAFDLGEPQNPLAHIAVRRQYVTVEGRKILLEIVPLRQIQAGLNRLPLQSSIQSKRPMLASKTSVFPKTPATLSVKKPMRMATVVPSNKGFVLDYVEIDADTGDITFQSDTTYYISAPSAVTAP
jgi:hypothetical protein